MLARILSHSTLKYADHLAGSGIALFEEVCQWDPEGIVAKYKFGPYRWRDALSTWYEIRNRNYSQQVGRNEFFEARRAEVKRALTFLPLRTLSAQEVTSSVLMKLRMRERGIPAISAAAAEYSMNPSCVGPCESVPNDIRHPASFASRSRLTFRSWRSG